MQSSPLLSGDVSIILLNSRVIVLRAYYLVLEDPTHLLNILDSMIPPLLISTTNTIQHSPTSILHPMTMPLVRTRNTTPPSMALSILIINQQLSMLSIPSRLISCYLNDFEPAFQPTRGLAEYIIDFFKRTIGGLWVEEVDDGEDEGVYHGEYYVGFVADGCK